MTDKSSKQNRSFFSRISDGSIFGRSNQSKTDQSNQDHRKSHTIELGRKKELSQDVQKVLAEWDDFEMELARKRRSEAKDFRKRAASVSLGNIRLPLEEATKAEGSQVADDTTSVKGTDTRPLRALSVSDASVMAHEKTIQRRAIKEKRREEIREIRQEMQAEEDKSEPEPSNPAPVTDNSASSDDGAKKVRSWKVRMDNMRGSNRQDYVNMYKTLAEKVRQEAEEKEKEEDELIRQEMEERKSKLIETNMTLFFMTLKDLPFDPSVRESKRDKTRSVRFAVADDES
eukprot:TRINITY_DN4114_c0_g1_i1.p1 TRINITY_DN4114_c0_g1~~TRINITY_DN4114_c0_g1_i1.p1  ORF type:complete len:287 (-),score=77.72 TRINITY_DN4114_c0_g1_i1:40-900(-)